MIYYNSFLNNYRFVFNLTITEKFPSLNEWYSSNNKFIRIRHKQKYKKILEKYIEKIQEKLDFFYIELKYNNRLDCDNNIPIIKILCDELKEKEIIINDNNKYFKGLSMLYDNTLPKNTYSIDIYNLKK